MQKMIVNSKPPEPDKKVEKELPEQFPSFTADREQLNQRIEEILADNSDVASEYDKPENLFICSLFSWENAGIGNNYSKQVKRQHRANLVEDFVLAADIQDASRSQQVKYYQ